MAMPNVIIHINGDVHLHLSETNEKKSLENIQNVCRTLVADLTNLIPKHEDVNESIINAFKYYEKIKIKPKLKHIYKYCSLHIPNFVANVKDWRNDIRVRCQWLTIDKRWIEGKHYMSETAFGYLFYNRNDVKLWRIKDGVYETITPEQKQKLKISYSSDSNYKYILIEYDDKKVQFKKNRVNITKTIL